MPIRSMYEYNLLQNMFIRPINSVVLVIVHFLILVTISFRG